MNYVVSFNNGKNVSTCTKSYLEESGTINGVVVSLKTYEECPEGGLKQYGTLSGIIVFSGICEECNKWVITHGYCIGCGFKDCNGICLDMDLESK